MNFTYTVIQSPDGQYGTMIPNGSWSGQVGMLQREDIDMGKSSRRCQETLFLLKQGYM